MPIPLTLTSKLDSRKWNTDDNASVEMVHILTGTSDDLTAKTLIENSTAQTHNGLTGQPINLDPEWADTTVHDGRWIATVRYGVKPAEVGESSFPFDTGGGTQHVTQSISTLNRHAPPGYPCPTGRRLRFPMPESRTCRGAEGNEGMGAGPCV